MKPSPSLLIVVTLALVAAAAFETFPVSPTQLELNERAWAAMDEPTRDDLRRTWRRFNELTVTEQQALHRRMVTLTRLEEQHTRRTGKVADEEELKQLLESLVPRFLARLPGALVDPPSAVKNHTRKRIDAFLDSLVSLGLLPSDKRPDASQLPWTEFVHESLALLKKEEIRLAEKPATRTVLSDLDPLDVTERMRAERRLVGYLGRASRYLQLTDDEKARLARLPEDHLLPTIRRLLADRVRALLEERDVAPEMIERILKAPPKRQERFLDDLLEND